MPFSHHSHSGQFCGHAKNTLEEMVQKAIARGMRMYALTEHMPRDVEDFYPGEIDKFPDAESLAKVSDLFYDEALRMRSKYQSQIKLLIGFEGEWIRPSTFPLIQNFRKKFNFDLFVGSVHHVHAIPIDYDRTKYEEARDKSGGTDERLFEDYYDSQLEMLQKLNPPVVGHFDLIRLMSDDGNRTFTQWNGVWSRIVRNLKLIAENGGVIELNSSALRKGLSEAYPKVEICQEFLKFGGRFCLSDDAHGSDQVGLNYARVLDTIRKAGIETIHYCSPTVDDPRHFESVAVVDIADQLSATTRDFTNRAL